MDATHCGFDGFCFQNFIPNMHTKNCLIFDFNLSDRDFKVSLAVVSSDKGWSLRGNDSSLDSSCRSIGNNVLCWGWSCASIHLLRVTREGCWFWACWLRCCRDSIKSAYWSLVRLRLKVWVGVWRATGAASSGDNDEDWTSWREIESIEATGCAMLELCNLLRCRAWATGGSWGKSGQWHASLKDMARLSLRWVFDMEGKCE